MIQNTKQLLLATGIILFIQFISQAQDDGIRPYYGNPSYWQYRGVPMLLLGGSDDDNLYQWTSERLQQQLDALTTAGGNYLRCTMSYRDQGNVMPWVQVKEGKYDLDRVNEVYWQRFSFFLEECKRRDIIVQIEIWATYDYLTRWGRSPFNPRNNINYTTGETSLPEVYEPGIWPGEPDKPCPFYYTIPEFRNDSVVLGYQKAFVDHLLSISLKYDNVLYCIDNEIWTSAPLGWGLFWARYIHKKAVALRRKVYVTEMHCFPGFDIRYGERGMNGILSLLDHTGAFDFLDISNTGMFSGEYFYRQSYEVYYRVRQQDSPRPVNFVKIYGNPEAAYDLAVGAKGPETFWIALCSGMASARFHRPPTGIGISGEAQMVIRGMRQFEERIKPWECKPRMDMTSDNYQNEAYLLANPGKAYGVYFPVTELDGIISVDFRDTRGELTLEWLNIETGVWSEAVKIPGGNWQEIQTPKEGSKYGWAAVILSSNFGDHLEPTPGFHADNVPLYGAFEFALVNDKPYSNKFDFKEIELQASFTSPSGEVIGNVFGFYDGDGRGGLYGNVWRLRFMPTEKGRWKYEYSWTDGTMGGKGTFNCIASDYRGPLQIDSENPYYFRTMNGEVFHAKPYDLHQVGPMGSILGPSKQPAEKYRGTDWSEDMDDVHAAIMDDYMVPNGYNLTMLGSANHEDYPPSYWVDNDSTLFNIPVWKVTENVYLHARKLGIYCFQFDGLIRIKPVKTIPTLNRWNEQLVRYYCARLSSISSHTGFNPTRENYKLPRRDYSKERMNELMLFCQQSIPSNYGALLTIHDNMYEEFSGWQDFAIRQHPSQHVEGNSKDSQQGNNNDRGVDIDEYYEPYDFPVIGAEDVWEGLTQNGVAECIRPVWGQLMAGIIPLYSEWNRWIKVQGTGVAEKPYRRSLEWWFEKTDYRKPDWKKMNELVSSDNPYEIGCGIPGREYIAYREGNGPITIDLTGIHGEFYVSFYNPFKSERYDRVRVVPGGTPITFDPPYEQDDVVVLLKRKTN